MDHHENPDFLSDEHTTPVTRSGNRCGRPGR